MAELEILADDRQRALDPVAVDVGLVFAPGQAGVDQDVFEVLFRLRRK